MLNNNLRPELQIIMRLFSFNKKHITYILYMKRNNYHIVCMLGCYSYIFFQSCTRRDIINKKEFNKKIYLGSFLIICQTHIQKIFLKKCLFFFLLEIDVPDDKTT